MALPCGHRSQADEIVCQSGWQQGDGCRSVTIARAPCPLKCAPVGAWNSFKGQDQDHARALLVPGPMASAVRSGQFWQALSLALSAQASHRRTSCLQEIRMRSSPPCVEVEPPKLVQQR